MMREGICRSLSGFALLLGSIFSYPVLAQPTQTPLGEGSQRISDAKPGDVRLLVTDGLHVPLEKVRADLQKAVGHTLVIEYSESHILQKEMDSGVPFEVALVTQDVIDAEIAKGTILPNKSIVARIKVGIFQRGDAPLVDVSTPDALKKALLGAKAINWSANAAAEPTAFNVFNILGLSNTLKPRLHPIVMGQPSQQISLAPGEYELRINIIGETTRPPYSFAGEIPQALEVPIVLPAGIGAKSDVQAARAVVKYLMDPSFTPVLAASHLGR